MHTTTPDAQPVTLVSRKTGLIVFATPDRAKAEQLARASNRAVSRILCRIKQDGEMSVAEAVQVLRDECPALDESDATKLIKETFHVK